MGCQLSCGYESDKIVDKLDPLETQNRSLEGKDVFSQYIEDKIFEF